MNTVLLRHSLLPALRAGLHRPAMAFPILMNARQVASTVSNRPASQTFEHAKTNFKEETGNVAADIAKTIAGGNFTKDSVSDTSSFIGITRSIARDVPRPVMLFGLAGALPYVGTAATTVYLAHQAGLAAAGLAHSMDPGVALTYLDQALNIQMTYGAVMLSFLGALHWGMEFAGLGGQKGYSRLMLGAAPVMFAWPTLALQPMGALTAQWFGFTALWWADAHATSKGWTPAWYSQYRFYLSVLVGTCIIGSLAGTSYYGPVAGHGFLSHDLELIREQRKELMAQKTGKVKGSIEAAPRANTVGEPDFIYIKKRNSEAEKKEQKQEQEK